MRPIRQPTNSEWNEGRKVEGMELSHPGVGLSQFRIETVYRECKVRQAASGWVQD